MPVAASDIVFYGSASMPDDDAVTDIGGAIDTTKRVVFTDIDSPGSIEIVSSAAGDTSQTVTVTGRNSAGEIISDVQTLNGTTPVAMTGTFERLLKAVVSASHTGTVTVRKASAGGDLMVFATGELEIRRICYNAEADVAGGSARDYYEKVFAKNNHSTLSATNAVIKEQADPSGKFTFALEASLDGTGTNGTGNNRQTVGDLSGLTFDGADKNVANSQNHSAGAGQGIWIKLSLAAGDSAANTSYTLRESFSTVQ